MKYDYVIVGAGFTGATFARLATNAGKKCVILERRSHIAGNCYTYRVGAVDVHAYGPHIFHTSNDDVWNFVNKYAKFNRFTNRTKVFTNNRFYSFPINMMTLHQLWGVTSVNEAKQCLLEKTSKYRVLYHSPKNLEEWALNQVGDEIYELFIKGYTKKQWMRDPSTLPADIIKRIPIRLTWNDDYFNDTYQGIPVNGYTELFSRMLDGIEVILNVDYNEDKSLWESLSHHVIYTGSIDQLHSNVLGTLDYRTTRFETSEHNSDIQGNAIINYTSSDVPWTRVIEHIHFSIPTHEIKHSVVTKETPIEWSPNLTPMYPINDSKNDALYESYKKMTSSQYTLCGRLGRYCYYDMHQAIAASMSLAKKHQLT